MDRDGKVGIHALLAGAFLLAALLLAGTAVYRLLWSQGGLEYSFLLWAGSLSAISWLNWRLSCRAFAEQTMYIRARDQGRAGVAVVHALRHTGVLTNGDPELLMELSEKLPGRPERGIKKRFTVPFLVAPSLERGREYSAKIDPDDLENFVVEAWE